MSLPWSEGTKKGGSCYYTPGACAGAGAEGCMHAVASGGNVYVSLLVVKDASPVYSHKFPN